MKIPEHKLVILGSADVGKSALAVRFVTNNFEEDYIPTIEDSYRKQLVLDNEACMLEIIDTAGQEEFRPDCDDYIQNADGFILVFSSGNLTSFKDMDVYIRKIIRIRKVSPACKIPMVMVMNRFLNKPNLISFGSAKQMAYQYGIPFIESYVKDGINVDETFHLLVREIRKNKKDDTPCIDRCALM